MKITKWVDIPSVEIDVHITGEEAVQAVIEDPGEDWTVEARMKQIINGAYGFFSKVSDEEIATLTDPARRMIAKAFRELADRFCEEPTPPASTPQSTPDTHSAQTQGSGQPGEEPR